MTYVLDKAAPKGASVPEWGHRLAGWLGGHAGLRGALAGVPLMLAFLLLWEVAPRAGWLQPDLLPAAQQGCRRARRHDRLGRPLPACRHQPAARRRRLRACGRRRHPARLRHGALQRLRAGDRLPRPDAAQHLAVRADAGLHPDPRHRRGVEDRHHLLRRGVLPADQHHRGSEERGPAACSRRRGRWAPPISTSSAR